MTMGISNLTTFTASAVLTLFAGPGCGRAAPAESKEVLVPAGAFIAGADCRLDKVEPGCDRSFRDSRSLVFLDAFYIDRNLVTRDEYKLCVQAGACADIHLRRNAANYANPEVKQYIVGLALVPYERAQDYCGWFNKRLPTPDEFERIARGTDGRIEPWGTEESPCSGSQFTLSCLTYMGPAGARSVAFNQQWVEGGLLRGTFEFAFEAQRPLPFAYFRCARTAQARGRSRE